MAKHALADDDLERASREWRERAFARESAGRCLSRCESCGHLKFIHREHAIGGEVATRFAAVTCLHSTCDCSRSYGEWSGW